MKKRWVKIRDLYYKGISVVDISNKLGCSYSCVYSAIFEMKRRDLIDDNMKDKKGFGGSDKSKPLLKKGKFTDIDRERVYFYKERDVVGVIKKYRSVLEEEKLCSDCMTIAYGDGNCHCGNNNWDLVLIKKFVEVFG